MNYFSTLGYDTWCVDMEGYGRSSKHRDITCDIANGADDLAVASAYIQNYRNCGLMHVYGISSGALRAATFAERHPERVARLALDAFVWTGEGSPTLADRTKNCHSFLSQIGAQLTMHLCSRSLTAIILTVLSQGLLMLLPRRFAHLMTRCQTAPISICVRVYRLWTRKR